jgi:hypothetical protein
MDNYCWGKRRVYDNSMMLCSHHARELPDTWNILVCRSCLFSLQKRQAHAAISCMLLLGLHVCSYLVYGKLATHACKHGLNRVLAFVECCVPSVMVDRRVMMVNTSKNIEIFSWWSRVHGRSTRITQVCMHAAATACACGWRQNERQHASDSTRLNRNRIRLAWSFSPLITWASHL